jgi:hypothetical protein
MTVSRLLFRGLTGENHQSEFLLILQSLAIRVKDWTWGAYAGVRLAWGVTPGSEGQGYAGVRLGLRDCVVRGPEVKWFV